MVKEVKLGQKVKDKITGFEGIVTAKLELLNGCLQMLVIPRKKAKDKEYPEGRYIDVEQLDIIDSKIIKLNLRVPPSGGVRQMP